MAVAAVGKTHHGSNDVKTQFCTKEGCYRSLKLSEYSRPVRLANNAPNNIPVRLSFVTIKGGNDDDCEDKIAFNVGRDMFFYNFKGAKKVRFFHNALKKGNIEASFLYWTKNMPVSRL